MEPVSQPVVVSVGGSVVAGEQVNPAPVEGLASTLDEAVQAPLAVVVGGGAAARRYIEAGRRLGLDEAGLDELGIEITRANAWLLIAAFGPAAYPTPAESLDEATRALGDHERVCMGGTHAGHTTDAVAAMVAERTRAQRLVVVTNVDGVYTSDPKTDPDAERLDTVTPAELAHLAGGARAAGSSSVIDPLAAQIIERSSLEARVVGGDDHENLARALEGGDFGGTRVADERAGDP